MSKLSDVLKQARESSELTLREVEKNTGISNAYLSQIEKGKVGRPSPEKLRKLSSAYSVDYGELMSLAGHEANDVREKGKIKKIGNSMRDFLASQNLTDDELNAVASFLKVYRSSSKKRK